MGDTEEGERSIEPPDFLSERRGFADVNEVIERRKTHFRNYPIPKFGTALMEAITEDEDSRILSRMTYNQRLNGKNATIAEDNDKGVFFNVAVVMNILNSEDADKCAELDFPKYHIADADYPVDAEYNFASGEDVTELQVKETITDNNGNVKTIGALGKYHPVLLNFYNHLPHTGDKKCRCSVKTEDNDCENFGAIQLSYESKKSDEKWVRCHTHTICFACYRNYHTQLKTVNVIMSPLYTLLKKWDNFTIIDNQYIHSCNSEGCTDTENLKTYHKKENSQEYILEENVSNATDIYFRSNYYCEEHFVSGCVGCGKQKENNSSVYFSPDNLCYNCYIYLKNQKKRAYE